eukprot:1514269-Prymnesium_polylepis.1
MERSVRSRHAYVRPHRDSLCLSIDFALDGQTSANPFSPACHEVLCVLPSPRALIATLPIMMICCAPQLRMQLALDVYPAAPRT